MDPKADYESLRAAVVRTFPTTSVRRLTLKVCPTGRKISGVPINMVHPSAPQYGPSLLAVIPLTLHLVNLFP